jgi:hypothetical protein
VADPRLFANFFSLARDPHARLRPPRGSRTS